MTDSKNDHNAISRRSVIKGMGLAAAGLAAGPAIITRALASEPPIRVGVLTPLTGAWTVYGKVHLHGLQLAVSEINAKGGVLGRKIELVISDTQSNPGIVAQQANRLVRQDNVDFVAGTFSSASRDAAAPAVTAANKILLYPTFYEGQHQKYYPGVCNDNIFMFGPVPSQQVWPHLGYMTKKYGRKFFMIGSDYVWPRVTNEVTKSKFKELGGTVVGELYIPFNTPDYSSVLQKIKAAKPDVVFLTLVGSDTVNFRKQFVASGMNKDIALWTVDDAESVTLGLGPAVSAGTYVSFDYFMSIKGKNNALFLQKLQKKFGKNALMTTVGVGMYNAGHMAAMAITKSGDVSTQGLRAGLKNLVFDKAPQGSVAMRAEDNQAVLPSYLMQVNDSWTSPYDMFKEIQAVKSVVPKTAACTNLPLD